VKICRRKSQICDKAAGYVTNEGALAESLLKIVHQIV
jgi:hypothetical protein